MPTPLSPASSQEIVPVSPPRPKRKAEGLSGSTTLPRAIETTLDRETKERLQGALKRQRVEENVWAGNATAGRAERERERGKMAGAGRETVTGRMLATLGKETNPITNSDLYARTDHFVSAATGHQQSNRGSDVGTGRSAYYAVRDIKLADHARKRETDLFSGCVVYVNGSTGPRVSNIQLRNLITTNGGRLLTVQNRSCTHVVANGGLSGSKTQKWIDGQGGKGGLKRVKVVRVEWVLDSVDQGKRLSESLYGMIADPTQTSLLGAFGAKPKVPGDNEVE